MLMNNIKFAHPWLFLLIIPLLALILVPFIRMKAGKKSPKNIISLIIHLLIALLITTACVDVSFLKSNEDSEVYVLADVSESNNDELDKIDEQIQKIYAHLDNHSSMGVVTFAKNYELLSPLGSALRSVKESNVDKSATNIESAIQYTSTLYHDNVFKKMILISDGGETDNHVLRAMVDIQSKNIQVDAIYLDHEVHDYDVQINSLDYINKTYIDRNETVKASIQAGNQMRVPCTLYEDGKVKETKNLSLMKGINIIEFALNTETKGNHSYYLEVKGNEQDDERNNIKYFVQEVVDEYKVMIVGDKYSDCNTIAALYNENCVIDPFFNREETPYLLEDLCKYDEFVFANANIVGLPHHEELVTNLEKVVATYGKSLVTYGTTYASGTSSETMSKYNNMLPVQFETNDTKCVALVIDASSSMDEQNRLQKAKEGAIACLDLLGEQDYVTVITFGDKTNVIQPLTSARNREQIINAINNIQTSYATNMRGGLLEADSQLRNANFETKNVIVLSDGLPADDPIALIMAVNNMTRNNIACSFLNISSRDGASLLSTLANEGNGTYYYINQSEDIVDVILQSVADEITNTRVEGTFEIHNKYQNDPVMENVTNLPSIHGYNFSRIKGSASTIYTVTYTNDLGGEREVPLLAYWNFGKGKVMSFTSDLNSSWASDLYISSGGRALLNNMVHYLEPSERVSTIYDVEISTNGYSADCTVNLDLLNNNAYLEVILTHPDGTKEEAKYFRNEVTTYQMSFSVEQIGLYTLDLIYHNGENTYRDTKYFDFSYSKEYDYFHSTDEELLYQIVGENGIVAIDYDYVISYDEASSRFYDSISLYLILVIVILFIVDIMIRKLRFSDLKALKRRKRK